MMDALFQYILKVLARHVIAKEHPTVIAVTGTVGKTSTREAIASVLASTYRVRMARKNYNNEWGVPFTILDVEGGHGLYGRLGMLLQACRKAIFTPAYPQILVLEFGIDKPGDMQKLCDIVKLDYAVVTSLGNVPVHVENFSDKEALWEEKLAIVKGLKPNGVLVYNADDQELAQRAPKTAVKAMGFGSREGSHIRATNAKLLRDTNDLPVGISCMIQSVVNTFPLSMPKFIGTHQLTSTLAAAAVGMALKVETDRIQKSLAGFEPLSGRLKLLLGVKDSFILDDTYNASPQSTKAALEVLGACAPHRRIAVLGDMLELGAYTEEAHRAIGKLAAASCDLLFTVGTRSKFIADQAHKEGFPVKNIREFIMSPEAGKPLESILRPGDVVLVKGSQGMRMEKVVESIMAQPEKAGELLVRQEAAWKRKEVKEA